ncbi:MAG: carbohydrate ABC transporter permease [Spirochaetaceae bacterium]|jgi:multiple sugar transport system permease protein|nr:carbohydrate ABC transporter permease [Spirochaetaceae bacterium]
MNIKLETQRKIAASAANIIIILFGILMLYPVVWLIMASFKEGAAIFSDPGLIPKVWTIQNYLKGWNGIGIVTFGAFFSNSFIICILCLICNAAFCSMTAYAFGRLQFPGRGILFGVMMLTLMLPAHVTTIPRYIIFRGFGWIDTFLPLIVPKLFATDAFFIFLLVQFIRGLPKDLDESARIDGCGKFGIYLKIILPLSVPSLITTVLFTFLWTWDDFFNQLLYLNSPQKYTIPMGLRLFLDSSGISSWGSMFAMSVLSILPCFVLFFSLQKYFVQGIATTGMKG